MFHQYLIEYAVALIFIITGFAFIALVFALSSLLRPSNPSPEKLSTYECGEVPIGESWFSFHVRYYFYAFLFVIFDVEVAFLFPWAVVFRQLADWVIFFEMVAFVLILVFGLVYAWKKGALRWA